MWIHFDDMPIGAEFTRTFVSPTYTKINSRSFAEIHDACGFDRIVATSPLDGIYVRASMIKAQPYCCVSCTE